MALLVCAMAQALGAAEATLPRQILTHGTRERLWVAEVDGRDVAATAQRTAIFGRRIGEGERWQSWSELAGRVVLLSNRGSDLIVLLDSGKWMVLWPGGGQTGPALPGHGSRILTLASDEQRLWAIGLVPGGMAGLATRPATTSTSGPAGGSAALSSATTSVATAPSGSTTQSDGQEPPRAVLFSLEFAQWAWQPRGEVPMELSLRSPLSLAVVERHPTLALADEDEVHLWRFEQDQWVDDGTLRPAQAAQEVKLLAGGEGSARGALWMISALGAGELSVGPPWSAPQALDSAGTLANTSLRAATLAAERVRLFYYPPEGKQLVEQQYDLAGTAQGGPAPVELRPTDVQAVQWWIQLVVMVALMLAMVGTLRRRRSFRETMELAQKLPLAPLSRRLLGGIIDAAPVLAALFYLGRYGARTFELWMYWPLLIGAAAYLLHTTLVEVVAGRTLGKMVAGLRVTTLEGEPPRRWALLWRNLLRVVDLPLMGLPLVLVLYSPLRQRIGDVAAGTVVVWEQEEEGSEDK